MIKVIQTANFQVEPKDFNSFWSDEYVTQISNLPSELDINNIKKIANRYRQKFDSMLIVGCGASSIPTQSFYSCLQHDKELLFVDNMLDADYIEHLLCNIKNKSICVNVVSRSCKTREVLDLVDKIQNIGIKDIILTICEANIDNLPTELNKYEKLCVKRDLSGRFSNFTEYNMFPLCFAGVDIESITISAQKSYERYKQFENSFLDSPFGFGLNQNELSKKFGIEIVSSFENKISKLFDWYIQIFMESLSKNNSGTFYTSSCYPADLHFKEQYYQQGTNNFYEVFVETNLPNSNLFFATKNSLLEAHQKNNINIIKLSLQDVSADSLGELIAFVQTACMFRAYLNKINCFDQAGVEAYKSNIKNYLK